MTRTCRVAPRFSVCCSPCGQNDQLSLYHITCRGWGLCHCLCLCFLIFSCLSFFILSFYINCFFHTSSLSCEEFRCQSSQSVHFFLLLGRITKDKTNWSVFLDLEVYVLDFLHILGLRCDWDDFSYC